MAGTPVFCVYMPTGRSLRKEGPNRVHLYNEHFRTGLKGIVPLIKKSNALTHERRTVRGPLVYQGIPRIIRYCQFLVCVHGVGCCGLQDPEVYCFVIRGIGAIHRAGCERAHHDTVPLREDLAGQDILSIIIIAARGSDDVGLIGEHCSNLRASH